MSAIRYSGKVRIAITYKEPNPSERYSDGTPRHPNGSYQCELTHGLRGHSVTVGAPACLDNAVDSSEAFDRAASAALSFANDDDTSWGDHATSDREGCGWHVGRSAKDAWPQ